ncbi:TPA: hypothetical protein TVE87_000719 [Streptococcus equi subsp. zooepidemicus]|uniref:hypothetical protein n=1 Tax=Streptococcus equi TaxID=1336 RepID=UPI00294AECA2|nr:hypothetical protein [Streptococcus equi]WOK57380.1 hypothetical protein RIM63_00990 [Streptococcus equi subsp. zooepidemicus]HEL1074792.1 hypothetical protein [Streptococcus equi subsp. zooepidemicus]
MKKLVLASAAVLVLAGAVAGTGEVRASVTRNDTTSIRAARWGARLQINNIRKSYEKYTSTGEAAYYLRLAVMKRSESEINKVIDEYREACQKRQENNESSFSY